MTEKHSVVPIGVYFGQISKVGLRYYIVDGGGNQANEFHRK